MLKLTRLLSATVFCFVGFHTGFGSVGHNISKVGWFSLYNIWKCTYRQQCNQGIYCRNACWYCALILVVLSLVSSITIWSYWVSYGSEFPYFCGIPDMPNDLPQHQSRQNLLLLLMRSTDMMETFWHLVLIMSIYRHSIFVMDQVQISGSHHRYLNCPWKKILAGTCGEIWCIHNLI